MSWPVAMYTRLVANIELHQSLVSHDTTYRNRDILLRCITQLLYVESIPFANITQYYSSVVCFARAPHSIVIRADVRDGRFKVQRLPVPGDEWRTKTELEDTSYTSGMISSVMCRKDK